jgi:hypothetical protein
MAVGVGSGIATTLEVALITHISLVLRCFQLADAKAAFLLALTSAITSAVDLDTSGAFTFFVDLDIFVSPFHLYSLFKVILFTIPL